jgi:acyl-coenzyme A thioesterase PaaI-like protein
MNRDTVSLFAATRHNRSLGLVLAGVIFALIGVGGSGAIVRSFVTAGSYAAAPVTTPANANS